MDASLPSPVNTAARALDRKSLTLLVDRFYASVRADELLGPVFEPVLHDRWPAHLARMVDFWCASCKIERGFRGNVYDKHMVLPDMAPAHLARWLQLWRQHTEALFAPAAAARLQAVAVGVARVMHLGWFGELPSREELERLVARHTEQAAAEAA